MAGSGSIIPTKESPSAAIAQTEVPKRHYTRRAPGTYRGGRPRKKVKSEAHLPLLTFTEVAERLDAMTVLQGRSRNSPAELYLVAMLERDERRHGLDGLAGGLGKLARAMEHAELDTATRAEIEGLYRRTGLLTDEAISPPPAMVAG